MSVATNELKHANEDIDIHSLSVEEGVKWAMGILKEYAEKLLVLQERIYIYTAEYHSRSITNSHRSQLVFDVCMHDTMRRFVSPVRGYASGLLDFVELAHEIKTELQLRLYEYEERVRFLDTSVKILRTDSGIWKEIEKAIEATGRPYQMEK